jgi:RIO kinase 2
MEGNQIVIKIHRLGRTSFRAVRKHRDYLQNKSKTSWLYMSRLAATKEFAFMQALYSYEFPVPKPIDANRHIVVMSRVPGIPLAQMKIGNALTTSIPKQQQIASLLFQQCLNILRKLAESGLIHCDFNEFNLLVTTYNHTHPHLNSNILLDHLEFPSSQLSHKKLGIKQFIEIDGKLLFNYTRV